MKLDHISSEAAVRTSKPRSGLAAPTLAASTIRTASGDIERPSGIAAMTDGNEMSTNGKQGAHSPYESASGRPANIDFGRATVRGIEVVQTVQDLRNGVPLIAGKATVVRIYLGAEAIAGTVNVTGEIGWSRGGGGETFHPTSNTVTLDPANDPPLGDQRADVRLSLNLFLPSEALATGTLRIRVTRLIGPAGAPLAFEGHDSVAVDFVEGHPLRVRVIGLKYRSAEAARGIAPAAVHFDYLRSFLQRAYPTAEVIWSQTVVEANFRAPFTMNTVDRANAQVAAIRVREVSGGVDPRTHYYGLVDDDVGRSFMRGAAFAIPLTPQPDVVACGPCGMPNGYSGDNDRSYADWYGAHELGHTFGRFHPGFPPYDPVKRSGQDASDPSWPYPEGRITTDEQDHVGFDVGDLVLELPMRAMSGRDHHDIMTYREKQWISPYTYEAIRLRLRAEQELASPSV